MTPPADDTRSLPDLLYVVFTAPEFALDDPTARALSLAACEIASQRVGAGCGYYLPMVIDRMKRNEAIRNEYDGHNVTALCRCYGVSRRQLYRIVRA